MQTSQMPGAEEIYLQAKELYIHYINTGDLQNAEAMFEQLGDFRSAATYAKRCRTLI